MPRSTRGPLRLGFIGAGRIAAIQIETLLKRREKDVDVVALADVSAKTLEKLQHRFDIPGIYTDFRKMLAKEQLDAVSVCTPNLLHGAPTIAALKAGCDVMVEKPMAKTAAEAKRMLATAEALGRKLIIGFQYRFNPKTNFIKRAVDAGEFGKILYGRVEAMRRRGIPNWGVFGQKALQGGGPLIDIGVHALEMTHYAMGAPTPVSASADMFTYIGDKPARNMEIPLPNWDYKTYDVEDLAVGRIRFDNGAVIHIESSFAAHIENDGFNFQLMGERAGAIWDRPCIFTDESGHMVNRSPGWLSPKTSWQDMFDAKMHHFVDHVLYDQPTIAPGRDGVALQQMLDALYRSAERGGREVKIR